MIDAEEDKEAKIYRPGEYLALVSAEDYGQSGSFPSYRKERPLSNYFNSYLNWHNFVISDILRSENNVYLYEERTMGKDKNALCSLRICFLINNLHRCLREKITLPSVYISVRDNCVRQKVKRDPPV